MKTLSKAIKNSFNTSIIFYQGDIVLEFILWIPESHTNYNKLISDAWIKIGQTKFHVKDHCGLNISENFAKAVHNVSTWLSLLDYILISVLFGNYSGIVSEINYMKMRLFKKKKTFSYYLAKNGFSFYNSRYDRPLF